jgi:transglutaminase/protease-like cytokinesis protein 3
MRKRGFYIIFVFLLIECQIYGQIDFTEIDNHVRTIEYSSQESLAIDITKNYKSDLEKVRAIFVWITNNINYDYDLHGNLELKEKFYISENNIIEKTLERKKAICSGYSILFKKLCDDIGVESEVIIGFSKQYLDGFVEKDIVDHAWNSVKIDNEWYLLDTTWAAKNDEDSIDDFWFLTDPNIFIYSHYPENEKWTLLNRTLSKNEFYNLPTISNRTFFNDNIKVINPTADVVDVDKEKIVVIEVETKDTSRPILLIGFPSETYASNHGLKEPTKEEYIKMTDEEKNKYTLVIPSLEIINKEIFENKIIIEAKILSKNMERFDLIIDGNTIAKFRVNFN